MKTKDKHSSRSESHSTGHHSSSSHYSRAGAPGAEIFDQAMKSYEQALRTSARLQEDAARWWTNVLQQTSCTQEWQRQINSVMAEAIPTAEKNLEESLRLVDQSCKTGLNLLKRAVAAPRSNGSNDMQSQVQDLFQSSLNVLHSNIQAITESQARVVESWTDFMRRGINSTASATSAATAAAK
ncbi:MAG TPA: hypothetical protein VFB72_15315 [Verrucomicrobiae bacterium]|nr:hypothetical protein [Verrucomicrobiae bacterium]